MDLDAWANTPGPEQEARDEVVRLLASVERWKHGCKVEIVYNPATGKQEHWII